MWSLLLCTRLIITDSQPARDELDALDTQSFPQGARRALSWRQRQPRSYIPTQAEVQEGNKQRDALRQEYKHLVNAENLPPRPGRAGRGKTRLGLCLTGQLERLEIESKARHLVRDLNRTHDIDVVLVVANGTARYVNGFSVANSSAVQATAERLRSRTRAALIRTFVQAGASRVVLNTEPQWELPYLRKQYVLNLNKPMSNVHLANRARSHVRQWRSLWNCYKEFSALAQKAGQRYDVLAKFRDDLLIFDKVEALHERSVYENAVVTQGARIGASRTCHARWMNGNLADPPKTPPSKQSASPGEASTTSWRSWTRVMASSSSPHLCGSSSLIAGRSWTCPVTRKPSSFALYGQEAFTHAGRCPGTRCPRFRRARAWTAAPASRSSTKRLALSSGACRGSATC